MPKINCDICQKHINVSKKVVYDLDKAGFEVYCQECANKLNIDKRSSLEQGIKVYKM